MTARKVVAVRLSEEELSFLARNGLPLSEQLRADLRLVAALEVAERGKGRSLTVRDVRSLAALRKP